jgi:hypothetical protein
MDGVKLIDCKLTPLQAALIEWGRQHPYGHIRELVFQDGVPVKAEAYCQDGTGCETVLFDKFARRAGLLKSEQ